MFNLYTNYLDKVFLRQERLDMCKTQAEKDILLDRWQREDSVTEIADSIRSINWARNRWFW